MQNSKNQYDSPKSDIIGKPDQVRYVGFWARLIAGVVDSIWQLTLVFSLGFSVYGAAYIDANTVFAGPFDVFIQIGLPFLLYVGFWVVKAATPGKMIVKCIIVNESDFGRVSTMRFVIRYFAYIISFMFFGLGFIWIAFDSKKQGWHDKIAKTVVIYR